MNSPINGWVNPYTEWIAQPTLGPSVPKGLTQFRAMCYQKTQLRSLTARLPSRMNYLEFIVLGHWSSMHRAALSRYPG